jgi:hypothetical protein
MKKIIFILFVMAVTASLVIFRVPLIQQLSPKVAKYYGFDINRFEIDRLDINRIVIPMLAMQQIDGSMRVKVEIHDLVVDVDPYKAEVSAVSSSYVSIDIEDLGGTVSSSSEPGVNDIINMLPIFGISIERLEIKYHANNEELVRFEGQLLYAQNATLKGVLSSQDKFNLAMDLYVDELDFVVNVSQNDSGKTVMALNGDYQVKNDWLDVKLDGDLSFSAINRFLQVFGVDGYVQEDISTVKARFELDLTRSAEDIMQSYAADLDVDSKLNISSKNLGIKRAQVDVSTSCRIERSDTAKCVFKDPQRAVVAFYKKPDWLVEYFDNIGNEYIFEINPSDKLTVKISSREILFADIKGDAAFNIDAKPSRLKINGVVSDFIFNGIAQDWQLDTDYNLALEVLDVSAPAKISRLLAEGQGRLNANEKRANISVKENFVVNLLNASYEGYATKNIRLKQINDAQFVYRYQDNYVKADDVRFVLTLNQLSNADAEVELNSSPIQLQINTIDYSSANQKVVAQVDVNNISLTERSIPIKAYELNAGVQLKGNQLAIDGGVGLGEQKNKLKFSVEHDLLVGLGRGTVNAGKIGLANNKIISNQITESGFPLQLKGGSLDVDLTAIWNVDDSESEITVKLLADQVMGDYAQNQFSGFNTELEFVGQDGWALKQAANIKVDIVNVGVPVKDVSMRLERMEYGKQEKPLIRLSDLAAGVLDGSIYSEEIEIDLNRRENMFTVFMSSLSLEKLIALNQTEDLIASGTINGELPMRLDNGVLLIDKGWLRADDSGGYIKYGRIGEVLADNKNLKLVGELLEDFRYNEMSAQVDLLPGGRVTLATKLHGRSPNAELNKQVNLNFNIDFNLWKFLESARLLTRIDQDITKQILSKPKR